MTLVDAMRIIAEVQAALVDAGVSVGAWGPCGDGIDGRWGSDSNAGFSAFKLANGLTPIQVQPALDALGVPVSAMDFQTAVSLWNNWRTDNINKGRAYDAQANALLAEATGITAATCPQQQQETPVGQEEPPPADLAYVPPATPKTGWPWWLWLVLGLGTAGAVTGGIWAYHKYGKKGKKAASYSGLGRSQGTEIGDEEFGGGDADDDDEVT